MQPTKIHTTQPAMQRRLDRLNAIHARGKWFVIIVYGVLGWGCATALMIAVVNSLMGEADFTAALLQALCIYPIAGLGLGWWLWIYFQGQRIKLLALK